MEITINILRHSNYERIETDVATQRDNGIWSTRANARVE